MNYFMTCVFRCSNKGAPCGIVTCGGTHHRPSVHITFEQSCCVFPLLAPHTVGVASATTKPLNLSIIGYFRIEDDGNGDSEKIMTRNENVVIGGGGIHAL